MGKQGKLYVRFIVAAAIIALAVYAYSAAASAPVATPAIVNSNGTLVSGVQIANATVALANQQIFFYSNFSAENASQEENSTFRWFKRQLYQPQNRSLVGYWKLDGNVNDTSLYGNNGNTSRAVFNQSQDCRIDDCLLFNGSAYVNVSSAGTPLGNLTMAATWEAWIKPATLGGGSPASGQVVAKWFAGGGTGGDWEFSESSSAIRTILYNGTDRIVQSGNAVIVAGAWQHIAAVYNGTGVAYYVNGAPQGTSAGPIGPLYSTLEPVVIGARTNGTADFLNGSIDEVAIYNYAKSADEIWQDYRNSPYYAMIYKDALVYLGFEDNGTNSAAGNVGGLLNATVINVTNVTGVIGNAFNFSETSSIYFPFSQLLNLTGNFTVMAWIQPQNVTFDIGTNYNIFDNLNYAGGPRRGWVLYYGTPSGSTISLQVFNGSTVYNTSSSRAGSVPEYAWSHVVGLYNGSHIAVYVNGELHGTAIAPLGGFPKANTGITIGYQAIENGVAHTNGDSAFNGLIDEVALYNRSLSPQEIKQLYLRTWYDYSPQLFLLHPSYPDEVDNSTMNTTLLLRFNDANLTNVTDSSAYGNNGFASGSIFFTNNSISGAAVGFDGSTAYVNTTLVPPVTNFTIELWMYWTGSGDQRMFGSGNGGGGGLDVSTNVGGGMDVIIRGAGTGDYLCGNSPPTNTWLHLAVVMDNATGTGSRCYRNGALANSSSATASIAMTNPLPLVIGASGILGQRFQGFIDEVKVVNRSLTAAEIAADYRKGARFATTDYEMPVSSSSSAVFQPGVYVDNLSMTGNYVNTTLYLRFDDSSGQNATDISSRKVAAVLGNDGNSANDEPTRANDSVSGKSLLFDGSNDLVNVSLVANYTALTMEAWVYWKGSGTDTGFIMGGIGTSATELFEIHTGGGGGSNGLRCIPATGVRIDTGANWLPSSRWAHVACVYEPSKVTKVYINGVDTNASITNGANPMGNITSLAIGIRAFGNLPFNGYIDEVRILNRSLTAAEVLADYKRGANGLGLLSNSYINYSNSPSQNFNEKEGTIEFWVKPTWDGNDGLAHTFFNTEAATAFNITKSAGNNLAVYLGNPGSVLVSSSAAAWTNGTWKHVGVTWSNYTTNITLHVDGALVNTTGATAFTIPAQKSFVIGARSTGAADWCNCTISELRISRKLLSAQEINESFSKGRQLYSNEHLLNSSNYRKDDVLKLEYAPSDSQSTTGARQNTTIMAIQNSPPVGNISFPMLASPNMSTALNWLNATNLSDPDGDAISVNWFVNGSFNQSGANVTLAATPERNYVINMSLTDGVVNTANVSVSFMFDNLTPSVSIVAPTAANSTFQNTTSYLINLSVTEASLDRFILNITGPSFAGTGGSGALSSGRNLTLWDKDLVGMWHFEEGNSSNATTNDSSGFGNHGNLVNMNASTVNVSVSSGPNSSGRLGGGMAFDGINDYVNVSDSGSLDITGQITVEAWVYPSSITTATSILRKGPGANGVYYLYMSADSYLRFAINDIGWDGGGYLLPSANTWYHVVGTYNGSVKNLYVNGALQNFSYLTGAIATNDFGLTFGQRGDGVEWFNGTIDEVKIWRRALSAAEISAEYNLTASNYFVVHNFSGSSHLFSVNLTNLTQGNYSYFAWVNDTASQSNATTASVSTTAVGQRIFVVDTTAPAISLVANTPANNSFLSANSVFVNTSENDAGNNHNEYSAFVDFNNSLLGWWRFEEGSGTTAADSSTRGNTSYDGTLTNFACTGLDCNASSGWVSNGKRGRGINFDGVNDRVRTGVRNLPTINMTFEGWIYSEDNSGRFFVYGTDGGSDIISVHSGNFIIRSGDTAGDICPNLYQPIQQWHHFALVIGSPNATGYIDGVVCGVSVVNNYTFNPTTANPLTFGAGAYGSGSEFRGKLDDIKVWGRMLNQTEINASFHAGSYRLFKNFTDLSDGNYSYRAYVVDAAGNINKTENRTFIVDTAAPTIAYVEPTVANNSFVNKSWTVINTSVTESGESSAFIDFNNSLIGWWRLEEGTGTTAADSSTRGNASYDGTLTNFACTDLDCNASSGWGSNGKRGRGISFDGVNDRVRTGVRTLPTINMTLEGWFYSEDNSGRFFIYGTDGGNDILSAYSGGFIIRGASGSAGGDICGNLYQPTQQWHHFALVVGSPNATAYIDGVVCGVSLRNNYTFNPATGNPLTIGAGAYGSGDEFKGKMDDIKVWGRMLNQTEINASYSAGSYRLFKNFTDLSDGNYSFNVSVVDWAGNLFTNETRRVIVDTTLPLISYGLGSDANGTSLARNYIHLNVSVDELNPRNLTATLFSGTAVSAQLNVSANKTSGFNNVTFLSVSDGYYNVSISVRDLADNVNTTSTNRSFTVDVTTPVLNYAAPSFANASFVNVSWIFLNFSFTETNNDTFMIRNGSTNWTGVNASSGYFFYNFTNRADGNYTFFGWLNDTSGNSQQTVNRTIVVDTKGPGITYDASSFANATLNKLVTINVSANDTNNDHNDLSAFVDFNGSLVGYWRFEEGSGTNATDFSSYGNHGNLTNFGCTTLNCNLTGGTGGTGSGWTSGGKRGRAMTFDGENDYILINKTDMNLSTAATWEFWIKTAKRADSVMIGKWNSWHVLMHPNGWQRMVIYNATHSDDITDTSSPILPEGAWAYYVATYNNTNVIFYLNGVQYGTYKFIGPLRADKQPIIIGAYNNGTSAFLNGTLDEIRIWSRVLSAQEINASFQAGTYRLITNITGSQYADGNYSYYAAVVDAAGNVNRTGERIVVLDNTAPSIAAIRTVSNSSIHYYQISNSTSAVVAYFNSIAPSSNNDGGGGQAVTIEVTYTDLYRNSLAGNLTFGMVPFNHTALGTSTITYNISTGLGNATALVMANDTANNSATATVRFILDMNDTLTTDNSTASANWVTTNVTVNLTAVDVANGSGANRTLWCTFNAGMQPCTPTVEVFNPSGDFRLPLNCSSGSSCQLRVRYYSVDNVSNNESGGANGGQIRESNSINIATGGTDVNDTLANNSAIMNGSFVRASNITNSTVNNCRVVGSVVVRSVLFRNVDFLRNCTVSDSFVLDSNITSSIVEKQSYVDPSIITDSVITNSTIHNSTVSYSRIENSTFCGNFSVWTASILNNTLIDGRIVFNGSNYFGPMALNSICAGVPSSPVGSLVADPSVVNNSAAVVFRYTTASTGYTVTIGQTDLFGLDNTSTKSITLNDNGTYPDAVANDAVYSGNYTISPLNNQSDGNKTIVAQVSDNLGNNWTVRTNVTLDKTPPYIAIVANSNNMNTTLAAVTLNITFSDATVPVKDCRFANEDRVFGSYEACSTVKAWTLTGGNGVKTVVMQARDMAGNMNETNDTILLQSSATTIITPLSGEIIKGSKTVIVIAPDAAAWVTFNVTNSTSGSYTWNLAGTANAITNDTSPQDGFTQAWTTTAAAFASEWKFNLTVISFDAGGNQLSNDTETNIEVDNAGPSITFNVPASGATYNRTINLSVAVTSDTRKVTFEYSPNSGVSFFPIGTDEAGPDWNALFDTTAVADASTYVVRANATDDAGNSANASSSSFTIDNTGPTLVITVPGNGSVVRNNVTMQWIGNESNLGQVSVDGGPFVQSTTGNTHSLNTTILADGAHTLQVRNYDAAGNLGLSQLQVVQVDNTNPGVSIIYPLNGTNLTGTVFVVVAASAEAKNVTFRASNDNFATFVDAGCTASQTTVDSTGEDGWSFLWATATCTEDSDWQIRVTAEDSANNRRNYTVGVLRVDNTVPTVNLLTPADSDRINGTVTISATTGADVVRVDFEYSTQSGVPRSIWYPVGSDFQPAGGWNISWNTRDLPDGSYGVRAKAVDAVGLTHFDENGANFDIDNTPPAVSITSPAAGAKVSGTATIEFTLDGALKAGEIQFDGGSWIATSGSGTHSWNTASVNDSAHAVRVRGNDSIANVGYSDIRTLIVDNTNPIVTITNPQNNSLLTGTFRVVAVAPSDTRNVTFNLTGGCNTVYDDTVSSDGWTWDLASASACGTGDYAVTIFAIAFDAVGNRQLYSTSGITIDNDDPDVQMIYPNMTANITVRGGIVVSANASSDVQRVFFEFSPNNGTYWLGLGTDFAGTDGWNITFDTAAVADGASYKIRANATDKAGLSKVSAMLANFTIDNTAPVLNITFPRPGSVVNGTFNVTFTGGERGPTISVDGRPPTPADNLANYTWNTSAETEGTHTLRVNDSDAAGNIGYSNTVVVKVDNTPGVVQVLTPRDNAVVSRNVTIIATAPDNARQVKFELFNGSDYNTTIKTDTNPADGWVAVLNTTVFPDGGSYRFRANASDELGLFIAADEVIGIIFDNTAPTVAVDVPNANGLYKGTLEVNASSSADTSSVKFEYRRGTGDWTAIGTATSSPFRVLWDTAGLPDAANYEVRANATDRAGLSATASNANVEIDNTPPVITINNPPGGSTVSGTINITFSITGSIHSVQVQFDGGSWAAATASTYHLWDTTQLTDQAHILRVRANDSVNNTGYSDLRIVTVNNGGAPVAILSPSSGGYKSGTVTIEVSAPGNTYNVTFNISNSTAFYNTTGTQSNVSVDNVSNDGWTAVWDTARFAEDSSYNINVQAFTSNNTLLGSRSVTGIEVDNLVPNNVTNMTITPHPSANSGAITLNWTSSTSNDVDVYRVHRSQTRNFSAVSGTLLKSVSANSTTDSVPSGTWYYKVVVADNVGRESNASNEVNVTVTLAGPTGSLDINATYARSNDTVKFVYTGSAAGLTAIINASEMQKLDARVAHDFEKLWATSSNNSLNLTLNSTATKAGSFSMQLRTNESGALNENVTVDLSAAGIVNLSSYNRLLLWIQSNITGNVLNLTFGTDNYTQAGNFTVNIGTANSWEHKVFDISSIPVNGTRGNRSSIRYLMFNVTTATPMRLLLDDLEASSQVSMLDTGVSGDDVAGDAKYSALYNVTFYSNVSDGAKTVKALVDDGAGNFLSPQDTVTVDNTIPFANMTVNDGAATTTGTSVTLTLAFTDGTSGVKDCRYTNGASFGSEAYESCQTVKAWVLSSGGGTKTVSYEVRDNAGNTNSSSDSIVLDTTVPSLFITYPAPGARVNGTVNITFSGSETNAPQISIDGANYTATTLNNSHLWYTANYSEGSHTLRVKDTDSAGNVGYTEPLVVEVDNIPGVVTILQPKDNEMLVGSVKVVALGPVNTRNMTFWLRNSTSGQLVLVYSDTLVEDGWNFTLDTTLREDGVWELSVNATDDRGRYIDTATALNLRIDNVAPSATLQQPANGATLRGTVIINVTASSDAKQVVFEYSNDSGTGWQPIGTDLSPSAGWTFAWDTREVNDASTYRIRANVSDYAGLSAIAQNTADFTVDNTAPVMNITAPAPGSYVTGIVTIAFTGNQSANSELSIDGNVWTNITNATSFSWNTSAYNDGTHTLQVRNNDSVGNTGYSPVISMVADNTNPSITIINPLAGQNVTKTVNVMAAGSSDISSVRFFINVTAGGTFSVKTTDSDGSNGWGFSWDTSVDCSGECAQSMLAAEATDRAGLKRNYTITGFEIDNSVPTTTLRSPADSVTIKGVVVMNATTASDAVRMFFEYSRDGNVWFPIGADFADTTGWTLDWDTKVVPDGTTYRTRATATDNVGLTHTATNGADITIDNTPPVMNITAPAAGAYVNGIVTVAYTSSESLKYPYLSIDGSEWINVSASGSYSWNTSAYNDGTHTLQARDNDTINNTGFSRAIALIVDNANPIVAITFPHSNTSIRGNVSVLAIAPPDTAKLEFYVNAGSGWALRRTDTNKQDGWDWLWDTGLDCASECTGASLRVNSTDVGGLQSNFTVYNLEIDNSAPSVTLLTPANGATIRGAHVVGATSSSDTTQVVFEYSPDSGTTWYTIGTDPSSAGGWNITWQTATVTDAATYRVRANATDNVGLSGVGQNTADFTVDNIEAATTIISPKGGSIVSGNFTVVAVAPDTAYYVLFKVFSNGTNYSMNNSLGFTNDSTPADGWTAKWNTTAFNESSLYNLSAVAYDVNGNYISNATEIGIEVDNAAPSAPVLTALPAFDSDGVVQLEWSNVTASTADVIYYNIYRSTNVSFELSAAAKLKNVSRNFNKTTDFPGVNAKYYYKVTVVDNALFESPASNEENTIVSVAEAGALAGVLSVNDSIVKDGDAVVFRYSSSVTDLNVTINSTELQRLDNSTRMDLRLMDSGASPDEVADDAVYTANFTLSALNNISDGIVRLVAIVNDSANNQFLPAVNITLDNTRPNASIIINSGDANTSSAAVTLRIGFNDTFGVQSCRFADEDRVFGSYETCSTVKAWTLSGGSGLKTVVVQVRDNADNVNETNDTITYQALAAVTIIRPVADAALAGNVVVEAVGPATAAKMEFRIYNSTSYWPVGGGSTGSTNDSVPENGFSATWATPSFVDTIYNLTAIAYDANGNYIANDTNANLEVDNTAPAAPVLTALPAFDSDGVVALNWSNVTASAADVVYYNVYRSANISFALSSATRIKNVSRNFNTTTDFPGVDGTYYYKVTAVDNVLLESAASSEASTTITTAVGAVFGTLAANQTIVRNGSSVLLAFTGNKLGLNVSFNQSEMQRLDNTSGALLLNDSGVNGDYLADDAVYSGIHTLSMLNNVSDGLKQLTAEVNDSAGNLFRPKVNITLDNTKPNASIIINGGLSLATSRIAGLAVGANDSVAIDSCRFANEDRVFGDWEGCTATKAWQLSALTGSKAVVVQARDKAGNVQEANDSIEYRAPIAGELTASPAVVRNSVNITFTYTGSNVGFNATVNTTELQRLDNTSAKDVALLDDGIGPDAVANDGVYTGNYSISSLNNVSDGIKRITSAVNDTEGNVLRPAVNITLDNTRPNATITIFGLSPAGFTNISTEYTFSRAVTLATVFNDTFGIGNCRFANENQQFTDWEGCTTAKSWLLSDGNGNKTVILEARDVAGNVNRTNDTIYLNTTAVGLDQTPPATPTVVDDGLYTSANVALHAKWNATDYENDLLHVPLEWEYRIAFDNFTRRINDTWQYAGIAAETTVYGLNLSDGANYTFEVRAINTAGLRGANGTSDGIIVDTTPPGSPLVNSTASQTSWTSGNVVTFNFTAADNVSGVASFSYVLDSNATTIPDNVPESMSQHTQLSGSYNDGKSTLLKFNSTGNASAVFIEVKSNASANDVLRVTLQLAESSVESPDAMGYVVYAIASPPTGFDMTGSNISRIVNTSQDIAFVSSVLDATTYAVDVPMGTAVAGSRFFVAVAGDMNDDNNRLNLLLAASNTSIDSSMQSYQCQEGVSGCSNTTATADYGIKVELRDLKQDNIWHRTYAVGDGRLYFHVKAKDSAGNIGSTANYTILVDTSAPSIPQMNQSAAYTNTTSVTFNWTQSTDADSGVNNYSLQVDNSSGFSSPEFYSWVGNVTNRTVTGLTADATYFARVHSSNLAGVNSSWSSSVSTVVDTTAPSITFSKPSSTGVVASQDVTLVTQTNEKAICTYSGSGGADPYKNFTYTNSTYHETRVGAATGSNTFSVQCKDTVLNTGTATLSFTVSTSSTASSITLQSPSVFTGDVVRTNATVTTSTGQLLGEIGPSAFAVTLNSAPVGLSVFDNGAGNYTLMFDAPSTNGTYTMAVTVGSATASTTLNVQALLFTVQYVQSGVAANTGDRIIYFVAGNFSLGLATDSKNVMRSSTSSALNLTSNARDGTAYIFVTRTGGNVERVESLLKEQKFLDAINPSFGYAISLDTFVVYTNLEYDAIALSGNKTLTTGRYNLIIENKGFDTSVNKTKLEVRVQ